MTQSTNEFVAFTTRQRTLYTWLMGLYYALCYVYAFHRCSKRVFIFLSIKADYYLWEYQWRAQINFSRTFRSTRPNTVVIILCILFVFNSPPSRIYNYLSFHHTGTTPYVSGCFQSIISIFLCTSAVVPTLCVVNQLYCVSVIYVW